MSKISFFGVPIFRDANFALMRNIFSIFFSMSYAFFLANLPVDGYVDRGNYINYVINAKEIFDFYIEENVVALLQNEPVWLVINIALGYFFIPEVAVRLIIFFSALIFSFSIFNFNKKHYHFFVLAIFVCLLPQVMKNYIIHLRQGVAIALFVFAITSYSRFVRGVGVFMSPLIHSSFFFVVANYLIALLFSKKFIISNELKCALVLMFVCLFNLAAFFAINYSEARQIKEYELIAFEERSGFAFLFWSVILILFLINKSKLEVVNLFAIISIVSYLILYYLFSPAARIFESVMPVVLMAGGQLEARLRNLFYSAFVVMFLYQWIWPLYMGVDVFQLAY